METAGAGFRPGLVTGPGLTRILWSAGLWPRFVFAATNRRAPGTPRSSGSKPRPSRGGPTSRPVNLKCYSIM